MKILAVDTALGGCSAAVLDGVHTLSHRLDVMERGHAEALASMVACVMEEGGVPFEALDRLAVTTGPGTFTGQRVGLAFMRGLRLALKRPLIGVTTLEAMAAAARAETGAVAAAVLHDAKRGEVYVGAYTDERILLDPALLPLETAMRALGEILSGSDGEVAFAGTGAAAALASYGDTHVVFSSILAPDALWVARLGARAPVRDAPPTPLYLRPPDARLPAAAPQ